MCTSSGSSLHSGSTGTMLPSRSSVGADDLGGHGADAESLQDVLLAHLKVVGARAYLRRELVAALLLATVSLRGPANPKSMNGRASNCAGSMIGSASCRTKSGEAQRNSSRPNTLRAINVESCSGPVPNTTSNPSLIGSTMLSTNRMSNRECRIALQERRTDPGGVVDADEDGYRDLQLALRLLSAAFDQGAHAVGLGQDVHGVCIDLLAEVGDGELMGVLAQQLDAEVGFQLGQLAADRGLRHSEQRRGLRQAAVLHHLAEHQQGIEVEGQVLFHCYPALRPLRRSRAVESLFQICNRVLRFCDLFSTISAAVTFGLEVAS